MVKVMTMQVPIAQVKKNLCALVDRVESGETVTILRHGRATAQITRVPANEIPRRVAKDDPAIYKGIDLNEPILGEIG